MEHFTTLSPEEIASCSARKPECDLQTNLEEALLTPFRIEDAQPVHFFSLNYAH